ncbi:MAG: hypothetical protein ACHQK9_09395 [Reyranellales bacterium]
MSDYIPDPNRYNPDRRYDKYGNAAFEPASDTGKGPYILLALLVAIGLVGGVLYFTGTERDHSNVAAAAKALPMPTPAPNPIPTLPRTDQPHAPQE